MTDRIDNELPENEAELLLPFYVNGTLDAADRQKVEAWLAENTEAADHLTRVGEELDLTRADAELRGVPSRHVLDDLMTRVGAAPGPARAEGFAERIWAMLSPRYALAGALALCAVVAFEAGYIVYSQQATPASYQTASGQTEAFSGPTALVAFASGVEMSTVAARLAELDLTIVDGPKPGGIFIVGAPDTAEGRAALTELGTSEGLTRFFQLR